MNTNTISLNWKSEAGPRQTKEVQNAIYALKYAGSGTKVLSTSLSTGINSEHVESTFGSSSDDETEHSIKRKYAETELFDSYEGLITRENFRSIISACEMGAITLRACQPVRDERTTPAQREKILQDNNARAQKSADEHQAKQKVRETEADAVAKDYPYLNRLERYASGANVAKNIRLVLKKEFPMFKFSVRSDNNSVNINWTDGPTSDAVDSKVSIFKAGHFDGMTDMYEDEKSAFTDAFGSVKYVFTRREYRDGLQDTVQAAIEWPDNLEGWELEQCQNRKVNESIAHTDLTGKGDFISASFDYEEQRYILTFSEIVPAAKAPKDLSNNPATGCQIEEHTHTKKGFQMWIVILEDRVDRDEFNTLHAAAKDLGGWYSRAWGSTPGGFAFKDKANAYKFAGTLGIDPDSSGTEEKEFLVYAAGKKKPFVVSCSDAKTAEKEISIEGFKVLRVEEITHNPNDPGSFERVGLSNQVKSVLAVQRPDLEEGALILKTAKIVERTDLQGVGAFHGMHFEAGTGWIVDFKGTTPHQTDPEPTRKATPAKSDKLRGMADKMQALIETKRAPMTQNATPKRSLEYKSRLIEGDRLDRAQRAMYALADALEAGTVPSYCQQLSKANILEYARHNTDGSAGYYEIVDTGVYANTSPAAVYIQDLLISAKSPEQEAEETKRKTAQLIESKILAFAGVKIPGFFVTHKEAAERVIYEADIRPGQTVLEPEAGTGNLADLARDAGGVVQCVEIRPALCEILELKGHNVEGDDFLTFNSDERFDRVVMNPPFEKGQDIDHVQKAYCLLKEGGRLVAIMGEGSFYRSDHNSVQFRGWLGNKGGTSEKMPEGSFKGAGEVNQTGTNTRIVIIEK